MANTNCPVCGHKTLIGNYCGKCGWDDERYEFGRAFLTPLGESDIGRYEARLSEKLAVAEERRQAEEEKRRQAEAEERQRAEKKSRQWAELKELLQQANATLGETIDQSGVKTAHNKAEEPINVIVDVGGTGTRLALSTSKGIQSMRHRNPDSLPSLINEIRELTNNIRPDALAMAVPCWVRNKQVVRCHTARWLEGDPAEIIGRELALRDDRIHLIHDGEAHALALAKHPNVRFGAIHFAVGTGTGLGVIGHDGNILRSLSGDSWEISDVRLITSAPEKEMWRFLSAPGFKEQQERTDTDGYREYGLLLGGLACQLSLILRPKTIGLSGGVIKYHWQRIKGGFFEELNGRLGHLDHIMPVPEVIVLNDEDAALTGLATLF
jgi:glucokinase